MSKLTDVIKKEFYEMIPPTVFFFVALHIVALIRSLMAKGSGIPLSTTVSVTIAALVLGKSVLLADMLPMINRFPQRPLIYNVAWKTLIYLIVAGVIHYIEHLIDFVRRSGQSDRGQRKTARRNELAAFLGDPDSVVRADRDVLHIDELARAIGKQKFMRMFFGPLPVGRLMP